MRLSLFRHLFEALFADGGVEGDAEEDLADFAVVADTAVRMVVHRARLALRDAQRTVMELERFPNGKVHLVVNRVAKKLLRQLHTTIDDAMDAAGLPLLGVVPEDGDIPRCLNQGVPLCDDNYYAARAFYNIARRIAGYKIPLMKI